MRSQFLDLLKDIGFLPSEVNTSNVGVRYENRNGGDRGMLGAVLCAGLAPNILQIPYSSRAVVSGTMAKKIAEVALNSRKGNGNIETILRFCLVQLIVFSFQFLFL